MRAPYGPFLELQFYFADVSEADALLKLVTALLDMGATFTGKAYAHLGANIRNQPFAGTSDERLEPVHVNDLTTLSQQLAHPHARLLQVHMGNATGIEPDVSEIITYVSISEAAAASDRHPLAIWTEGEIFSGGFPDEFTDAERQAGQQIYYRFRALVERLSPAYASITSEIALECPADLRHDPRSYAFRNFFVNRSYCGDVLFNRIQEVFRGAYSEPWNNGMYISTYRAFNPQGMNMRGDEAVARSVEVGKIIASIP